MTGASPVRRQMQTLSPHPNLARRRRLIAFALIAAVTATIAAVNSVVSFGLLPPSVAMRQVQQGAAVTHAMVQLSAAEHPVTQASLEGRAKRADLIGHVTASPDVVDRVARQLGVDPDAIAAKIEIASGVPAALIEPDAERRANQIVQSRDPYLLDVQPRPGLPILDVYAQGPSVEGALRLANTAISATNAELRQMASQHGYRGAPPVILTQLGPARGGPIAPKAALEIAALTFVVVFAVVFGLAYLLAEIRRGWLRGERARPADGPVPAPRRMRDDWPHTTRVLPWLVAAFIVMVWLVPINAITIEASLPIDLKLDRLVLPVIVLVWLLSLAAGGPGAPRWRFTRIHAAIVAFVAVAFLSVVLNAVYLDHTLELPVAIKKLVLLGAFLSIFLVVASVVRPREVHGYLTLILAMGVLCALGILWEYRLGTNLFYTWSAKLLPGFFHVTAVNTTGYDEIGRRAVIGPADLGLEAVAMLAMALPIGLVRLLHANSSRDRILYGLAVCVLFGGMIATYRKSALLAPLSICLVLAYFRRRELLRLAPLGIVILLTIPVLAPNALGSIVNQFEPGRLGVSTVSERVSDYDAIRPDLLSHPVFGRGYGSYEHTSYRILDNDLLMRAVETGLVGLVAFVLMLVAVVIIAAPIIRGRDPSRAPPALAVAAAATAFLVLAVLFDIMSFPHTPYLLMILLGLFAVVLQAPQESRSDGHGTAERARRQAPGLNPAARRTPAAAQPGFAVRNAR